MPSRPKLNICMLLPLRYEPDMLVYPSIEILSYITHFGHQVTWVISAGRDVQPQPFFLKDVRVYTVPHHHCSPGARVMAKIFNGVIYRFRRTCFILSLLRKEKYDLVFARADVFDGLIAAYIRRRYKIPFVFELPNPLEAWEVLKLVSSKPKSFYYFTVKFNEFVGKRLLYQADLVLPISKWLKDDFVKRKAIPESKIMTLPESANIETFFPRERGKVIEKYKLNDSKVVVYEGTLGKGRKLDILLQAFLRVRRERQGVKLFVVGGGDDEENLKNLASEMGIKDDVIFTGQVPQSEIPDFIAAADVGVSPVPPLSFYKFSSPIKMFEYMAMAKPVVANGEIPEHKEVLEQSGGGILASFTPGALAQAIIELLDNPEKAAEMGWKGREWVVKNRSYEVLGRQVEQRYFELLRNAAKER